MKTTSVTIDQVDANGIRWRVFCEPCEPPDPLEVAICREFLRLCVKTKTPRRGSYGLKHEIENWAGEYVSNGACIAAAILEGLVVSWD